MEQAEVIRLVEGHDWLWNQWWPALMELSPELANQHVGGSFPSVFATAAHMVASEMVWQARCEGNGAAAFPPVPENCIALKRDWENLAQRRRSWLEQADPRAKVSYNFSGGTASNTVSDIIMHLISHAHFHRGQLASQFRMLGLKPPSSHFIGFFRI